MQAKMNIGKKRQPAVERPAACVNDKDYPASASGVTLTYDQGGQTLGQRNRDLMPVNPQFNPCGSPAPTNDATPGAAGTTL